MAKPGRVEPMLCSGRTTIDTAERKVEDLAEEIRRVETLIENLSHRLNDPAVELSAMMRLTIAQNELEAYLRGIRYALGLEEEIFDFAELMPTG
jgi:archaellum component FlaC